MTPAEETHFITLWNAETETAAMAEISTHLRKHVITD
jgi:hypothetical protein